MTKAKYYTAYDPKRDLTFIMKTLEDKGGVFQEECVGWHYGEPLEEDTVEPQSSLVANYGVFTAWGDSSGYYVECAEDECAYIVLDSEWGCLTAYWTEKGKEKYMAEDMVFSLPWELVEEDLEPLYEQMASYMEEKFGVKPRR